MLARGLEADVVGLVGLRRYAEQGSVHGLGRRQVGDGMQQLSPVEVLDRVETDGDLMEALTA